MFPAKVSTASNESLSAFAILAAQTASVRDALLCRNALAVCKAEEECAWRKAILSPRAVTQAARLNSSDPTQVLVQAVEGFHDRVRSLFGARDPVIELLGVIQDLAWEPDDSEEVEDIAEIDAGSSLMITAVGRSEARGDVLYSAAKVCRPERQAVLPGHRDRFIIGFDFRGNDTVGAEVEACVRNAKFERAHIFSRTSIGRASYYSKETQVASVTGRRAPSRGRWV